MNARLASLLLVACGSSAPPTAPPLPPAQRVAMLDAAAPADAGAPLGGLDAVAIAGDAASDTVLDAGTPAIVRPQLATDCRNVRVVTARDLETRDLHAETVAVDGVPTPQIACTGRACPSSERCCNACGGGYQVMFDAAAGVTLLGFEGCSGMDCNYTCAPFGKQTKQRYRFVGTLDEYNQLTVTKYCRL